MRLGIRLKVVQIAQTKRGSRTTVSCYNIYYHYRSTTSEYKLVIFYFIFVRFCDVSGLFRLQRPSQRMKKATTVGMLKKHTFLKIVII